MMATGGGRRGARGSMLVFIVINNQGGFGFEINIKNLTLDLDPNRTY